MATTTTAAASEYREVLARAQRSTHFTMSTEDEAKRFNSNSWASSSQLAHSDPKVSYVRPTPPYKNASKVNITTATGSRAYESEMMGRYRDNFVLPPARCPQPPVQVDLGGCCDLTLAERYQSQAMRDNSTGLQSTRRSVVDVNASGRASFGEESFRWETSSRGDQQTSQQYRHFDRRRSGPEDFRALSSDYSVAPPYSVPGAYRDPLKGQYVRTREADPKKTSRKIIAASNRVAPPLRTLAALRPMPLLPM
ncbi:hypothetical protein FOZ60_017202 [Perkinsus olseni]|uniref:Uncharacterized protein n=1 Tax=Perkinsus olseni TaxID=32597 RepID=A0A7J6P3C3_PEROL|nr:hypothetical protein FOZ60_017202 [Perkinsus olseni]